MHRGFKTKIYPTEEQKKYFDKCFGVARFAYNWYLEKNKHYFELGIKKKIKEYLKEFNSQRTFEFPFVLKVNNRVYGFGIRNANIALERFFKKTSKYPKFKTKKDHIQSFQTDRYLLLDSNIFHIAKANKIGGCGNDLSKTGYQIKTSEDISFLKGKNVFKITISFNGNEYFAGFSYNDNTVFKNNKKKTIGIDLGIKTFATQSDNRISKLPKQKIIKLEKKINVLQRVLSKKQKDSNNYKKARIKLNKYYRKITNIRQDFLHKYTTWLAKNYKTIKIEDLNIQGMLKNRRLAKAIARNNFSDFRNKLTYKCSWYDSSLVIVDRFFASSKTCSQCGNKKEILKLSERIYVCKKCGLTIDRDLNAAINIANWQLN